MLSFSATFLLLSFTLSRRLFRSCSPSAIGGGLVAKLCLTLATTWTRLRCPWDSPGKNTGVGCYFLFQGIFLTQELNLGLLHCRKILSAIRVVSSACLRLLIFLPAILIPSFNSSSLVFHMIYSAYKLNKQSDNI